MLVLVVGDDHRWASSLTIRHTHLSTVHGVGTLIAYKLSSVPDPFLLVALNLLSGLTQGLGMDLGPYINAPDPNLYDLLTVCLRHPQAPVRQSAYARVGDMAMHYFPLLRAKMPSVMTELIMQLDPEPKVEFVSAWSVGKVALRYGMGTCSTTLEHFKLKYFYIR